MNPPAMLIGMKRGSRWRGKESGIGQGSPKERAPSSLNDLILGIAPHHGEVFLGLLRDGCPGGESPEQVGERVDRVIARSRAADCDSALFAHGHVLRVLAARWIGLPACGGQHFMLNTGTVCVLSYYRGVPAIKVWNGPLLK